MRRAIGVVRVSHVGARAGDSFVSPSEQRERIEAAALRGGLRLVDVYEEMDVSGGSPLAKRPGLRKAIEAVEAREAEVVVVAYFDRLVRSLSVQAEVVSRVEAAGGEVLAVDIGQVTHASSAQWLSSTMLGAVAEYHRRSTAERVEEARRKAIARGVPTFPRIPPGYRKTADGTLEPDENAPAVAEAFRMRADGRSIREVQAFLNRSGVERGFHGTRTMLGSRVYLGELHFGDRQNLTAHEAIVDRDTWRRSQAVKLLPGRTAKSERLLARLGVLRCAGCGGRMVVANSRLKPDGPDLWVYRCPSKNGADRCPSRATIKAEIAEAWVEARVREILGDLKGSAGAEAEVEEARAELARSDAALSATIAAFDGLGNVEAAREKLTALRQARDAAADRLLAVERAAAPARVSLGADDWDRLGLDAKRDLIRALIETVSVARGRGDGRLTFQEL